MDIKLPSLGEGADSGTVVNVFVKEGDAIRKDQSILELENEKAVASIPCPTDGIVTKIFVKVGDKINVGQRLLSLAGAEARGPSEGQPLVAKAAAPASSAKTLVEFKAAGAEEPEIPEEEAHPISGAPPAASPTIRKLAQDLGIDLRRVTGSERGGRIVLADLKAYVQRLENLAAPAKSKTKTEPATKPAVEPIDFSKWGPVSRKALSSLRKVISRRMAENWTTIPHVTQFDEADVTALHELRKKHAPAYEQKGARLTLTPFVLKALVSALQKHPIFNSSLDEASDEIVFKNYYHIGIAVDTEAGLIVPVLRNADQKSLLDLSKELEELARKARDRKVSADELKGGTFTISNQGGIGGAHFTPIVNKPEVAILGLGRSVWKPVVREQQIISRLMLPLALSYDHRVIDGGSAARFVGELVKTLESFTEEGVEH